jgi:TPR repeat protein
MGEAAMQTNEATETETDTTPAGEAQPRQRLVRRTELAQMLDGKLAEDTEAKDTPRPPDAWLERRLRTYERQMTAIEQRQQQVETNARASVAQAQETIKAMQATVDELRQRAEAAEAKAKASANELRTMINETALRVETVEGVARAALAENHSATPEAPAEAMPVVIPAQEFAEPAAAPAKEAAPPGDDATPPADDAPKSYLHAVRKSVAAATVAAQAQAVQATESKAARARRGMIRYILGSFVVLTIFATGAGVAFSKGVSDGKLDALGHRHTHIVATASVAPAPPIHVALKSSDTTPLDRLTARARAGDATAELAVGLRYLDGAQKDPAAALHWITLAAVHGKAVAQYRLGLLYEHGNGAPTDAARAMQWFEAAALQGNRKAMHELAVAYAQGQGTAKDPTEAARWFSRAAGFGYVDSQFNLAVLYERGEGVPQSLLDAYKWYAVASRAGDTESKARLEALRTQLSDDDLAVAQHAANAFQTLPYDPAANVL